MCICTMMSKASSNQNVVQNSSINGSFVSEQSFSVPKKIIGGGIRRMIEGDNIPRKSIEYAKAIKASENCVMKKPGDASDSGNVNDNYKKAKQPSEITFSDFLGFLKTAYQVQNPLEKLNSNSKEGIDWVKLKENYLVKPKTSTNSLAKVSNHVINQIQNTKLSNSGHQSQSQENTQIPHQCVSQNQNLSILQNNSNTRLNQSESASDVELVQIMSQNTLHSSTSSFQHLTPSSSHSQLSQKPLAEHDVARKKMEMNIKADNPLIAKLHEIVSEGMLDSILPYLIPSNTSTSTVTIRKLSQLKSSDKSINSSSFVTLQGTSSGISSLRRKSSDSSSKTLNSSVDSEVEILVCDEIKDTKKTFSCSRKLLVEKMGYFADITAGQRLEDMDISVHCDINIFDWLMRWVKRENTLEPEWPILDVQCVIPVLVSAAFLQMEPLLQDCLLFVHQNINEILKSPISLTCLNDTVLNRLASMYTNEELETIRDRKDKIISRLFVKMTISLNEEIPETLRGHYSSLCRLYRCSKCNQLVTPAVGPEIPCVPSNMTFRRDGKLISTHIRDTSWNLSDYILQVNNSVRSWRRTYWRMWGECHFLYCSICSSYFPACKIGWCCYHPDSPQFFTAHDSQKITLPIGRYPCCGDRAYRFQLISVGSGCKWKDHSIRIKNNNDSAILNLLDTYRQLIELEPPELIFPERLTRLVARERELASGDGDEEVLVLQPQSKEQFWWEGFELTPPRKKFGLLGSIHERICSETEFLEKCAKLTDPQFTYHANIRPDSSHVSIAVGDESSDSSDSFDEDEEEEDHSEESPPPSPKKSSRRKKRKHKNSKENGRFWQTNLSARSNQDIQRENEEELFQKMSLMLSKRYCSNSKVKWPKINPPIGGTYVRLETEWREANNIPVPHKLKNMFGTKYRYKSRYN